MKKLLPLVIAIVLLLLTTTAFAQDQAEVEVDFVTRMKSVISKHLGRPYVWGSSGLKSFDCSGFVWRVLFENGIITKRTTARKYYMMLPKVDETNQAAFGNLVFFDNLKHVGIVDDRKMFYHAQSSRGTNLSPFDPYWRRKITGYRGIPSN